MVDFAVTIIGSGSAVPMHGRHPSAQVVQYGDLFVLIDCGEGTQIRIRDFGIKPFKIRLILISHLHGDHFFGLPGLLSSYSHLGRIESLTIYGPEGIKSLLETIFHFTELRIKYPLEIIELKTNTLSKFYETNELEILTFPLRHRIPCQGYLFREKKETSRLDKSMLEKHQLSPAQIKKVLEGEDLQIENENIPAKDFFLAPFPKLSYAYCSDTAYDEAVARFIYEVKIIYHEATFKNELSDLAKETGHSTAGDAASIATRAKAFFLLLGHYSSRYKSLDELLEEAKAGFANSVLTEEGKKYSLRELMEQGMK